MLKEKGREINRCGPGEREMEWAQGGRRMDWARKHKIREERMK